MGKKKVAVIWDWDYTLVDSIAQNYYYASECVMKVTGRPKSAFPTFKNKDTYIRRLWSYPSWRDFYSKEIGLTSQQIGQVSEIWKTITPNKPIKIKFYPALPKMIRSFKSKGLAQAIQTDNSKDVVAKALREQNLEKCFGTIVDYFLILDKGLKHKPSPDGHICILNQLADPDVIFCIGDVNTDILAAKALKDHIKKEGRTTEVRTIWATYGLTPQRAKLLKSVGIKPDHIAKSPKDILALIGKELGKEAEPKPASKKPKNTLPSREECFKIMKERKLPLNIIHHSLQVNLISIFLANRLKENGLDIDVELVDRASLLHDLDKLETLHTGEHGYLSEKILAEKGYPLVGRIVKYHRFNFIHQPSIPWEAKILNYADKRVKHDQIVTLKERFSDLMRRYNVVKEDKEAIALFYKLEKDIFKRIRLNPDMLENYLKHPDTAR